jgi:hypothetical protein
MQPAILVIDVQKGCFQGQQDTVPPLKEACKNINLVSIFSEKRVCLWFASGTWMKATV